MSRQQECVPTSLNCLLKARQMKNGVARIRMRISERWKLRCPKATAASVESSFVDSATTPGPL